MNHAVIERSAALLLMLTLIVISIGGLVQIVPLFRIETTVERVAGVRPYSPLEQLGRNIYTREGCYTCHSQMIRPFRDEVERYGHYSIAAESMYDHPFLWGSKRTGPDLARVGGKYSNAWHAAHLDNPRNVLPSSIMPAYAFLKAKPLKADEINLHIATLSQVGVPYTAEMQASAASDIEVQASGQGDTTAFLKRYPKAKLGDFDGEPSRITEMDALIAYLQILGTLVDFADPRASASTPAK
ncbi:MAG: cytochrome-c oxidase, cbb3-type subunit II [Hyphomicrobium sp.]|jgi:cytochrome c oxidase cbb3-type subunit 2